jgi:hypothetical protein
MINEMTKKKREIMRILGTQVPSVSQACTPTRHVHNHSLIEFDSNMYSMINAWDSAATVKPLRSR